MATPVFMAGKFNGIIIINVFAQKLLDSIVTSEFFQVSIVDKNGNFIYCVKSDKNYLKDCSWSKYLEKNFTLKDKYPYNYKNILESKSFLQNNIFSKNVSSVFPNPDKMIFVYEIIPGKIEQILKQQTDYIIIITFIIFFISVPIAFLLSLIPIKLSNELLHIKGQLEQKQNILDIYVPISTTNIQGIITDVSSAFCKLTGYNKDELIGNTHHIVANKKTSKSIYKKLWKSITTEETWTGEIKNTNKNGEDFWINLNINTIKNQNGIKTGYQAYSEDITSNKLLYNISITDGLTTLYNRRFFDEIFPSQIKMTKRDKTTLVFCMIDIDHFKQFNDIYGHQEGDTALKTVAITLKKHLQRPNDFIFRLGGEEFGILFSTKDENDITQITNTLKEDIEDINIPHSGNSASDVLTISMGVYIIKSDNTLNEREIYKKCDESLYKAKIDGRNRIIYFNLREVTIQ